MARRLWKRSGNAAMRWSRDSLIVLVGLASALMGRSPAAAAGAPPALGEQVTIDAAQQQWVQDQLWCAQGDVQLHYQDISLRCDEVEVDLKTMHLHAEGNVILDQGETRMACDRMDFDLRTKLGTLYKVDAFFPPTYHFRGEKLQKLSEDKYHFTRGVFTSCDLTDKAPPWSIEVRDAIVQLEGYGHFRDATIKVRGVPIFYTPRLLWPVKRDRAAGFLVPTFGYSSQRGAYLGNSFFWPASRSFDTTFFVDLFTKHYLGLGQEARWAPAENAFGEIADEFVWDPGSKSWKWKANGKYNQLFPGGWTLHAELQQISDIDFFQRFEGTTNPTGSRTLYSYVNLARTWGPQALTFRIDHLKTFFTDTTGLTTSQVSLDRLGEVEYLLRSTRIGKTPLYVSADGLLDALQVNRSASLRGRYGRLDIFPTLSLLTPGFAWLNITPTIGARETYYTSQYSANDQSLVKEPISRHYGTAGVSIVGPSLSRIWARPDGTKFKHLFEPRIDYTYISNPGGSLDNPSSSPIPVFDQRDSVLVTNQVKWTLGNYLLVKTGPAGSREVASLEISQPYSLSDPLTPARTTFDSATGQPGQPLPASLKGPLDLWLRVLPVPTATLDTRADFDPVTHSLQSTSLSGGYSKGANALNLTWYSSYDPTGQVTSSQTRLFFGLAPGNSHWRLESQISYDVHQHQLLEQRYVFRWRGSCWNAMFEVHDYRIQPYKTRDYRISIDLTGLGTFLDIKGALNSFAQ
ncbi:MAG TPA: LPS assembly protein LptD [Thermoanaerobaculaceae bacterium]|nr:LPS assembly protein LptD [Thermoanaerobaculaceae bacterium]